MSIGSSHEPGSNSAMSPSHVSPSLKQLAGQQVGQVRDSQAGDRFETLTLWVLGDILQFEAPSSMPSGVKAHASLLRDHVLQIQAGRIKAVLPESEAKATRHALDEWHDYRGRLVAPGFVDCHAHYPQLDVIASPADGLLPWLEQHTFPQESLFADPAHASLVSDLFLDELLRHGVTTAMVFCSSHKLSAQAFFEASEARGLRTVAGKCLMDRNCPPSVRDETEQSLIDSQALIEQWHGKGRLGYALTPRFAPSCSDEQMRGAAQLADKYQDLWVQSHVAENHEEIAWVKQLYPWARSYLDVYEQFGLLRPRSMYAHCIHFDVEDRRRMKANGASAAVCPTSNLFLGSGLFDFVASDKAGFAYGLASDVGGGSSFSPFRTMLAAYEVARLQGRSLSPSQLWFRHSLGAAQAMDLDTCIGNLKTGNEADFIVLDQHATPLLSRRSGLASSLDELLFSFIVLADDRAVQACYAGGKIMEKDK